MHRHGLSIGSERTGDELFLSLKATGKLTHQDYESITPLLESALAAVKHPHVKMFIDASEFQGWEARAAWDDFKIGLRHNNEFQKVAILGHKSWQETAAKIGNWIISGEARFFEDEEAAMSWLFEKKV